MISTGTFEHPLVSLLERPSSALALVPQFLEVTLCPNVWLQRVRGLVRKCCLWELEYRRRNETSRVKHVVEPLLLVRLTFKRGLVICRSCCELIAG